MGTASTFISPADGTYLYDDFVAMNDQVADNTVGELDWQITAIANASTVSYLTATQNGVMRLTTAVTADGDGSALHSFTDGLVFGGEGGWIRFRVRIPTITGNVLAGNNFRIGADDSVTATDPTVGIAVESDAGVISLMAESADHGDRQVAYSVTGHPTLTSGTTLVIDTWHNFLVTWDGENAQGGPATVRLYIDGVLGATIDNCEIDDDEEVELKIAAWQDSGATNSFEFDIDYYEFLQNRAK